MSTNQVMDKEATYTQVIKAAYPGLDIHSMWLHTGEGQFNDILFVNEDLIFRFPRYEHNLDGFLREIEILRKLQGRLSVPIPNPIYTSVERRTIGETFMGYKMLTGKPLFRNILAAVTDQPTLAGLARQLASFLQELHFFSPTALGLDLPVQNRPAEYKRFFSDIQEHLFTFMRPDARNKITEQFDGYFSDDRLHDFVPALIHGDFGGSNILFAGNQITGVIDFGFAGLGDPATDLAAVSTFGDWFFAQICKCYLPSESILRRASFYRSTFALHEALHGFQNNDKEAFTSGMEQYL